VTSTIRLAACAIAAAGFATAALPSSAMAADYVAIVQEAPVNLPADKAWAKLKGFCDIGPWLKTTCEITSGKDGELGAVRKIAGRVNEVLVAQTATSYTYADVNPALLYHGTVEIVPTGKNTSKLVYSLFYDQASIPEAQRQQNKEGRARMFAGVIQTMKGVAEAK
jgi:hypothetical protein